MFLLVKNLCLQYFIESYNTFIKIKLLDKLCKKSLLPQNSNEILAKKKWAVNQKIHSVETKEYSIQARFGSKLFQVIGFSSKADSLEKFFHILLI